MKKWALSAIVYFLVVVGAYYTYTAIAEPSAEGVEHSNPEQHDQ
jgi:hypothetical protein